MLQWQLYGENVNEFHRALYFKYCSIEYDKHMCFCQAIGVYCHNATCITSVQITFFLHRYIHIALKHATINFSTENGTIDVPGEKKMLMHWNEKSFICLIVRWWYIVTHTFHGFRMSTTNVCLSDNCFLKYTCIAKTPVQILLLSGRITLLKITLFLTT